MRNPRQWYRDVQRRGRPLLTATAMLLTGALLFGVGHVSGQAWQQRAMEDFFCETAERAEPASDVQRALERVTDYLRLAEHDVDRIQEAMKGER